MQLNIPDGFAHIVQEWESQPPSPRHVIIIPCRVLDRYAFEKSVMRLLEFLVQKHNLRLILPEGAWGPVDAGSLKPFPYDVRAEVADEFLQKGEIAGFEALMITKDYPIDARGIDDPDLYKQCAELLVIAQGTIGAVMPAVLQLSQVLTSTAATLAPNLYELEMTLQKYKAHSLDLAQYFQTLAQKAEEAGIPLKQRYPAFQAAVLALRDPHAHLYRAQLVALRRALGQPNDKTDNAPSDDILEPKEAIRGLAFTEEETKLIFDLRLRLDLGTAGRCLARLLNTRDILTGLTTMAGTPFLVAAFKETREQFSADYIARSLVSLGISLPKTSLQIIDTALPIMEQFYELTHKRQEIFVRKALEYLDSSGETLAAMWITGFNVPNVARMFRAQGVSYTEVLVDDVTSDLPRMADEDATQLYIKTVHPGELKPQADVLSEEEEQAFRNLFPQVASTTLPWRVIAAGTYKRTVQLRNPKSSDVLALKIVALDRLSAKAREHLAVAGYVDPVKAFEKESHRMGRLNALGSAYISRMIGCGFDRSRRVFMFLEEFSERTLADYVKDNSPLRYELVEEIARQLGQALADSHGVGYYHGDLKPDNILFRNGMFVVTDWDLASSMPDEAKNTWRIPHAQTKAPETLRGHRLDKRADIWAYGVNVFYARTSGMPFPHEFPGDTKQWHQLSIVDRHVYEVNVLKHIENDAFYENVMRRIDSEFSQTLRDVIKRCLARAPSSRYRDGNELQEALR
jgi:hypothetical protein